MKPLRHLVWRLIGSVLVIASPALASVQAEKVFVAEAKKNGHYLQDGLITGGDQAVDGVLVREIRRANNGTYERWVVDLEGTRRGEPVAIARPPYYQVAVNAEEKRLVFTVFGNPRLGFDARKVLQQLKKSPFVESVDLMPKLEDESWTFVVAMKAPRPVEVFELGKPVRVIIDFKAP